MCHNASLILNVILELVIAHRTLAYLTELTSFHVQVHKNATKLV